MGGETPERNRVHGGRGESVYSTPCGIGVDTLPPEHTTLYGEDAGVYLIARRGRTAPQKEERVGIYLSLPSP